MSVMKNCKIVSTTFEYSRQMQEVSNSLKVSSGNDKADDEEVEIEVPTPEQFLKHLLQEGPKYPHDERPKYKGDKNDLPDFYNEIMFKKGQEFFHKNITGVFLGCYLALFAGFSQPFAKILLMTNKSSTPMTAYKRYSATILHMCTWYDSDFEPGSKFNICRNSVEET
ncbi:uncharacterized protein [Leptinotarsa decemlineata]|uniref:uncharacterized protein n=1 Tax=Leptinotarsa decemlineata TaxID=7539 RepID=UPI003D30489F